MTLYTDVFPDSVTLLLRKQFTEEGSYTYFVPNDSRYKYLVAYGQGAGGMGSSYSGGGALVKRKVLITPGELLQVQVGKVSTQSVQSDSFVKRQDNTVIIYADRGRGNGAGGLAANSTGDIKRDGYAAGVPMETYGAPASDTNDLKSLGFGGFGIRYAEDTLGQAADTGGGGLLIPTYYDVDTLTGYYQAQCAGNGKIVLEFYNADPGALN